MEGKSLFKDSVALTPESLQDPRLIFGHNALDPLLAPHSQNPKKMLEWLDQHVINNPYFDQEKAQQLRTAVVTFYEVDQAPVAGEENIISLADSFKHPGMIAKRRRLDEIFADIGPVVRATQAAVSAIQQ